ncbi:MAG: phage holin family protein [Anaerolineaceae bacterium]|nr:phage holin family protein [Anaerolineaceae bacterium]
MKKFLVRLLINTAALYIAILIMDGRGIIPQSTDWLSLLGLALIFGVINAILRPLLIVAGCPFLILTLGLGTLLINTLLFYLAGEIGTRFGVGFTVAGFWPAFFGALIVSLVSFILSSVLKDVERNTR